MPDPSNDLPAWLSQPVPGPGATSGGWERVRGLWPETEILHRCPQDPVHHAEGDVGTHTSLVLDRVVGDPAWRALPAATRATLWWAAAFHDAGKPSTTEIQPDGRIGSPGHSAAGEKIARRLLWESDAPVRFREDVCSVVRLHQVPFWLFERADWRKTAIRAAQRCDPGLLEIHVRADARGRTCPDAGELQDRISLSMAAFEEAGTKDGPFPFANDESRVAFFEKDDRDPHHAAHEDHRCTVTLVCGLPGAGKDTYVSRNLGDVPCLSLDAIRAREGISPEKDQGRVVQAAQEEARVHLRAGRDFVWNATNVTKQNRGKAIRLARAYGARVHVVWLEVPKNTLFKQNAGRREAVPEREITRLAAKMEPPHPDEAHSVEWVYDGKSVYRSDNAVTASAANRP